MTQERKKANYTRQNNSEMPPGFKRIPKIVKHYSGTGYMEARELVGNHPRQTMVHPKTKKPIFNYNKVKNNMKLLIAYMSHQNMPVLYKGFKGKNAENLRTHGYFNAKTPTSTSLNKFQAQMFTGTNGILLTLPPQKRLAIVPSKLIRFTRPREKEVILAPQRFSLKKYEHINLKNK